MSSKFDQVLNNVLDSMIESLDVKKSDNKFPRVNVIETGGKNGEIVLTAVVCGFVEKEIIVEVEKNVLKITGIREGEIATEKFILKEIDIPLNFSRKFRFGNSFDMKKIKATFSKPGILEIKIPRVENEANSVAYKININ